MFRVEAGDDVTSLCNDSSSSNPNSIQEDEGEAEQNLSPKVTKSEETIIAGQGSEEQVADTVRIVIKYELCTG